MVDFLNAVYETMCIELTAVLYKTNLKGNAAGAS